MGIAEPPRVVAMNAPRFISRAEVLFGQSAVAGKGSDAVNAVGVANNFMFTATRLCGRTALDRSSSPATTLKGMATPAVNL